jgi:hypothetical protein
MKLMSNAESREWSKNTNYWIKESFNNLKDAE